MLTVAIYIQDAYTGQYNRVDLFDDEKISVVSSIQNINDISKTYTDFSQTFTVPASNQNNKIFRHWYDNSNDNPFPTLVKSLAYIEIDTILFRKGKIQLESANIVDGKPQDYSITFIGLLGNLKDKFAGLFLKDLTSTAYDFPYSNLYVLNKVSGLLPIEDIMFPLISSLNYWEYDTAHASYDISKNSHPIRYNDLFPAIRVGAVMNMIEQEFGIYFGGYFATDDKFYNAYLWLKNSDVFEFQPTPTQITWIQGSSITTPLYLARQDYKTLTVTITPTVAGLYYDVILYKNDLEYTRIRKVSIVGLQSFDFGALRNDGSTYTVYIAGESTITFNSTAIIKQYAYTGILISTTTWTKATNQTAVVLNLAVKTLFPEIKIEDFFTGILKMFNLTCFTNDGTNYTVMPIDEYYSTGVDVNLTKYVIQDKKNLNRVKTFKKINFNYEKSESIINVGFSSKSSVEYGSLNFSTGNDGEDYDIKLPFENLGFQNLSGFLQVGYALKTDLTPYIPKPVILYAYSQSGPIGAPTYHFSTDKTGGGGLYALTTYYPFGQETLISGVNYSLNFNEQQSTLINQLVQNGLFDTYYSNYLSNIFNFKARLIKINTILPTSILTTLKLNDSIIIRDTKYIINTMTTDLTTGEVQFELLTDQRQ